MASRERGHSQFPYAAEVNCLEVAPTRHVQNEMVNDYAAMVARLRARMNRIVDDTRRGLQETLDMTRQTLVQMTGGSVEWRRDQRGRQECYYVATRQRKAPAESLRRK